MLTLVLIGFLGGLVTGVSPCVLPMLPVIFFAGGTGRAGGVLSTSAREPALVSAGGAGKTEAGETPPAPPVTRTRPSKRPLKIVAGLILSFSVFTLTGSFLLSLLGLPQDFLRWAGLAVLSVIGLGLIFPKIEGFIQKPFHRLPKISRSADGNAFVLGLGLGALAVPCAGPVLAAITVAGATGQVNGRIVALTVAFAVGVAVPLFVFALAGDRIGKRTAAYRARARTFRIIGGVLMLVLAVALAFNLTDKLQTLVSNYTQDLPSSTENSDAAQGALTGLTNTENTALAQCGPGAAELSSCGTAPSIVGIDHWFNTPGNASLDLSQLHGKVVLLDFWTYSCIDCRRSVPHVVGWDAAYRDAGLQVIGVHTPEFAFEKEQDNVAESIADLGVAYPVAMDNSYATWTNYRNRYWPAEYLIDAAGTVRHIAFGEGDYAAKEGLIRQLLTEANPEVELPAAVEGVDEAPATPAMAAETPEIYLAYSKSQNYTGKGVLTLGAATFGYADQQADDTYSLTGPWDVGTQQVTATAAAGIRLNYQSAEVYAVLGGEGAVTVSRNGTEMTTVQVSGTPRLYTLYTGGSSERAMLDLNLTAGVQAYAFTFG